MRGHLPNLAIDEAGSHEIDDSLGIQHREDGSTWICIHIADPTRMIKPNDELDLLARKRVCSIFLPENDYSMFPTEMVNHFNLQPGKTNCSLSFLVKLGTNGNFQLLPSRLKSLGNVEDYEIVPSLIDKVHCLTYIQADGLLNDDQNLEDDSRTVLSTLHDFSTKRSIYRQKGISSFIDCF